jgi:glycerol-3-phosphate acyltransferase PlsY
MDAPIYISVVAIICGYFLGAIPTAYLMGRLRKGIDIREVGTRNMGAMNVIYNVGIAEGITVLVIDAAKGAVAVYLAKLLGAPFEVQLAAGAVAVLGHSFPVFLKFRGGRGGATVVGVLVYLLMPWVLVIGLPLFGIIMLITRFPTLSYGAALVCCPFVAWLIYDSTELAIYSVILLLLIGLKYIPRIKEMRSTGGNWRRVVFRHGLKDRF